MTDPIRLEHFPAAHDERSAAWVRTARQGYHDAAPSPARVAWSIESYRRDDTTLTGAYVDQPRVDGIKAPVGTFATVPGAITLGRGQTPAALVASVGVRPTHRRRGILRDMMTHSLDAAVASGIPLALLTASEGGIYERFGFGVGIWRAELTVDTRVGLPLRSEDDGTTQQVDADWLLEHAPALFADFHAHTFGSVTRRSAFLGFLLFEAGTDRVSPMVSAAVHLSAAGAIDGFVFYRPTEPYSRTLEVLDLIALTPDAYFGLWKFLGSIDLSDTLAFGQAVLDEPLRHAVRDPRSVKVTAVQDELWARVLDPVAVLTDRAYRSGVSDTLVFDVRDALGYAAGTYELTVESGGASVQRTDQRSTDATLDVAALGSLLLGSVTASQLAASARITLRDAVAGERLDSVFAPVAPPRFYSHF